MRTRARVVRLPPLRQRQKRLHIFALLRRRYHKKNVKSRERFGVWGNQYVLATDAFNPNAIRAQWKLIRAFIDGGGHTTR